MELGYCNPVHDGYVADPFVLRVGDKFVAYGTRQPATSLGPDGLEFEVLTSHDLVSWQHHGGALLPVDPQLGQDYWAPEVAEVAGTFYMYYSVGNGDQGHHLRVATATSALGPFIDCGVNLTPHEMFAIDAHPFRDDDGTWYLYYARDCLAGDRVGTSIAVDHLDTMTSLRGTPRPVIAPSADWQIYQRDRHMYGATFDWHTLEGPCVTRRGGRYYLLYSGGCWQQSNYAVAWAVADHPLGPWSEPPGDQGRLLATAPGHVLGPGHNSLVTASSGDDVIVYHAWDPDRSRRRMCIDRLEWTDAGPTTPGPTWTPTTM